MELDERVSAIEKDQGSIYANIGKILEVQADHKNHFESITEDIKEINVKLGNHLVHFGIEMTSIRTDVTWISKFFWIICTASVGSLVAAVLGLILK